MKAVVVDIEGTTTPISFVKDRLFPWAAERIAGWVVTHAHDPQVMAWLDDVRQLAGTPDASPPQLGATLQAWIAQDRKATPLKAIQGRMWAEGYADGAFTAPVYADALSGLQAWKAAGKRLFVYSSGSVPAQKLLFGHSEHGDLTGLFDGWFDTTTGSKREAASYRAIAGHIGLDPADILFVTDAAYEVSAAQQAGMRTAWIVRPGDYPDGVEGDGPRCSSFDEVLVD